LTMPSVTVKGEGVKGVLAFPKPNGWYYGEKNMFTEAWDGKLKAKEKKMVVLLYGKVDPQAADTLLVGKDAQAELVFKEGDGDGLKLLTRKTKVGSVQQE